MKYKVVFYTRMNDTKEEALEKLEILVNQYLELGWQLAGGIYADRDTFYQAVYYKTN